MTKQSSPEDPATHLDGTFRDAFPSWIDLRAHLSRLASYPEYDERRALHQLLMADIAARLPGADHGQWVLSSSLSLPARVEATWQWPDGHPERPGIPASHVLARPAFDIDLSPAPRPPGANPHEDAARPATEENEGVTSPGESFAGLAHQVFAGIATPGRVTAMIASPSAGPAAPPGPVSQLASMRTVVAEGARTGRPGLGGLVRYTSDLITLPNDQVMGLVHAVPVHPGTGRVGDDPIALEMDLKAAEKVVFLGAPQKPRGSILGVDVPGFTAPRLPLNPDENLFADKACLLMAAPRTAREAPTTPWHRYKDLFDLYYLTQATPLNAGRLHDAVTNNWNFARMDRDGLPTPYRVYGDRTRPGDRHTIDEPDIDWATACRTLQDRHPALRAYPPFHGMIDTINTLLATLPSTDRGSSWHPHDGWTRAALPADVVDGETRPVRSQSPSRPALVSAESPPMVRRPPGSSPGAQQPPPAPAR